MKTVYIMLLQNKYLLMSTTKPKKKGNYLVGVRLFETKGTLSVGDICEWTKSKYDLDGITEVEDWV